MQASGHRREFVDVAEQEVTEGRSGWWKALLAGGALKGLSPAPAAHALQPSAGGVLTVRAQNDGIPAALRPRLGDARSSTTPVQFASYFMFEKRASLADMLKDETARPLVAAMFPDLQTDPSVHPDDLNVVVISTSPKQRYARLRSAGGIYHVDPGFQKMGFMVTNMGNSDATCQMTLIKEVPATGGAIWAHASPHYVFNPRFKTDRDAGQCVLTVIGIGDPTDEDFLGMETAYQTPNRRAEIVPLERSTDPNEVTLGAKESVIQVFDQYRVSEDGAARIERYKQFRSDVLIPVHALTSAELYKDILTSLPESDSPSDDDPFF